MPLESISAVASLPHLFRGRPRAEARCRLWSRVSIRTCPEGWVRVRLYGREDRTGAGDATRGVDTFHVVPGPFDGITRAIVALVYLASTIRSQSFALSQRFDLARASRLYFAPHPPVGFQSLQSFPHSASCGTSLCSILSCRHADSGCWLASRPATGALIIRRW